MAPNKNTYGFVAKGAQRYILIRSENINIDNGAATTIDEVLCAGLPKDAVIVSARPFYEEATDSSGVASANWKLGTAVAGAEIVAATAYEVSKAIGDAGADNVGLVPLLAGQTLFLRHTGIAATDAGTVRIQVLLLLKP